MRISAERDLMLQMFARVFQAFLRRCKKIEFVGLNVIVHGGKPFIENKGTFKKPGLRGMFDLLVSKKGG